MKKPLPQVDDTTASKEQIDIISAIKHEHRYTLMMLSVLKEQLSEFDIGKKPDYALMFDIIEYMSNFPQKFNYKLKNKVIQSVISKDPETCVDLENLLAEQTQIKDFNRQVAPALKSLLKSQSILQEEQLKIFCKNYIELTESHIELESQQLFPRMQQYLSPQELEKFSEQAQHNVSSEKSQSIEERFKHLSDDLSLRWEEFEDAANDFALAEFISIGALFESIEPISVSFSEIGKIVKDYSYKMYINNRECYTALAKEPQQAGDYIAKPMDCAKDCFDEYKQGMSEIAEILKKTKAQVYEPYESRRRFFTNK